MDLDCSFEVLQKIEDASGKIDVAQGGISGTIDIMSTTKGTICGQAVDKSIDTTIDL